MVIVFVGVWFGVVIVGSDKGVVVLNQVVVIGWWCFVGLIGCNGIRGQGYSHHWFDQRLLLLMAYYNDSFDHHFPYYKPNHYHFFVVVVVVVVDDIVEIVEWMW